MRPSSALFLIATLGLLVGCNGGGKSEPVANNSAPSGLEKKEVVEGEGVVAETGDTVLVRYKGWLDNGVVFDENKEGDEPFSFTIGAGSVIQGWDEGVVGMKVGGKRNLRVPYPLAYGEEGRPPSIPPKSTLNFDIELLEVLKGSESDAVIVTVDQEGTGREIKEGDKLTIDYTIKSFGGQVIESSEESGGPIEFVYGEDQLVSIGLEAALEKMKVGEVRTVTLPPNYAVPITDNPGAPSVQYATIKLIKIG